MLRATLFGAFALVALLAACTSEGYDDVSDTPASRQPATPASASESAASPSPSSSPQPGSPSPSGSASVPATNTSPTTAQATQSPPGSSSQPASTVTAATATPTPAGSAQRVISPDPLFQVFVDMAAADLAARLSIGLAAISVAEAKALTWNDGGLGCPRPGMVYTQAVQDGVFIRLLAGGKSYPYHQGGSRPIFLCEQDIR